MGRALASSLLGDVDDVVARPRRRADGIEMPASADPVPTQPSARSDTPPVGQPLSRRARRELRERTRALEGETDEPVVGSTAVPAPEPEPIAVLEPEPIAVVEPEPAPMPIPMPEAAPIPMPEADPEPALARPVRPTVRPRLRSLDPDPYAALPWPTEDAPSARERARRPVVTPRREGARNGAHDEHIRELTIPDSLVAPGPRSQHSGRRRPGGEEVERKRSLRWAVEWAVVLGSAVVVALLVQAFVIQLYAIPSASMFPTLRGGDRVLVNKLAYSFGGGVDHGDIIVFKRPASERTDDPDQPPQLIKRVIGLPGEVVEARGGVVYVDGEALSETGENGYLDSSVITNNLPEALTVPDGHVFVMGDNRERSHDSRFFGAIPESDIIGRAVVIAWPFNRWDSL